MTEERIGGYTPPGRRDPRVRFWSKVEPRPSGCWEWTGATRRGGYGVFVYRLASYRVRQDTAHRLSWEMLYGPVPDGLLVCHSCDNRRCVRPSHLWLGTDQDNSDDKMRKGRSNLASRSWRPRSHGTKLSEDDIPGIRARIATGESYAAIGRSCGVSGEAISLIARGKRWFRD